MKNNILKLTVEQYVVFLFAFAILILAIYSVTSKEATLSLLTLGFTCILVVIAAVNPKTILNFIWTQDKDGQKISFERHIATKKEIEKTISVMGDDNNFNSNDLTNTLLLEEAQNRPITDRSDIDFLLISTHYRSKNEFSKAFEQSYYGLFISNSKRIKSLLLYRIGTIFFDLKQTNEAEKMYRKAIEVDNDNLHVYYGLGVILNINEKIEEAEKMYRKCIEIDKDYSQAYHGLGILFEKRKKLEEAEKMYRKAIELDENSPHVYNSLGNILKKNEEAEKMYRKAIEIDKDYSHPYNGLGNILANNGKVEEAQKMYRKAIEIDKDYSYAYNGLGNILKKNGKVEEAGEMYKKAKECQLSS